MNRPANIAFCVVKIIDNLGMSALPLRFLTPFPLFSFLAGVTHSIH